MPTSTWKIAATVAALTWFGCDAGGPSGSVPPPDGAGVKLQTVATGLDFPLYLAAPAADPRLFVVEKTGKIRIVKGGTVLAAPFLDLSAQVSDGGEQGLLGLAFDPQYGRNGRFFVDYTDRNGNTHITRFTVSADPDVADASSDLLGSLLRLDVSGAAGYAVPADNPFTSQAGARGELWNIGLRNPWRFSFRPAGGRSVHRRCGTECLGRS